jgi:hypothetical protein
MVGRLTGHSQAAESSRLLRGAEQKFGERRDKQVPAVSYRMVGKEANERV